MAGAASNSNRRVALIALGGAFAMLGLTYASVPLYSLFCKATGYNGTPKRAEAAPAKSTDETVAIRFDANTAASLGWNFRPEQAAMTVKLGAQNMAHYRATNLTDRTLTGSAVFNVTPDTAGAYFNKIQCFCLTEQTLMPGESVDLPVVFFVDPAIAEDPNAKAIGEITLSYTFYPVDKPKAVSAAEVTATAKTN